jgi:hypothetical protein
MPLFLTNILYLSPWGLIQHVYTSCCTEVSFGKPRKRLPKKAGSGAPKSKKKWVLAYFCLFASFYFCEYLQQYYHNSKKKPTGSYLADRSNTVSCSLLCHSCSVRQRACRNLSRPGVHQKHFPFSIVWLIRVECTHNIFCCTRKLFISWIGLLKLLKRR